MYPLNMRQNAEIFLLLMSLSFLSSFEEKEVEVITLPVPLKINGIYRGDVDILLNSQGEAFGVDASLMDIVQEYVEPAFPLLSEKTSRDFFYLMEFDNTELIIEFAPERLELSVTFPSSMNKSVHIAVSPPGEMPMSERKPAEISAVINMYNSADLSFIYQDELKSLSWSIDNTTDTVLRWKQWVMEGNFNLDKEGGQMNTLRFVSDMGNTRVVLGSLNSRLMGYQREESVSGLSFHILQPSVNTWSRRILLGEETEVSVWINNQKVKELTLSAGNYLLTDFPLSPGLNKVRIEGGTRELYSGYVYYDSSLLREGSEEFYFAAGIKPWVPGEPYYYLSLNRGVTPFLNTGFYFQGDFRGVLLGTTASMFTPWGSFRGVLGVSYIDDKRAAAGRLVYTYSYPSAKWLPALSLSYSRYQKGFMTYSAGVEPPPHQWTLSAGQKIPWLGGVAFSWTLDVTEEGTLTQGFNAAASKNLPRGFSLFLYGGVERIMDMSMSGSLTLSYNPEETQSSLSLNHDLNAGLSSFNFTSKKNDLSYTWGLHGASVTGSEWTGISSGVSYTGNRSHSSLSLDTGVKETGSSFRLSGDFNTALLMADGFMSWSSPVRDSFALIVPGQNLTGFRVGINPQEEGYEAVSDMWGYGVLSQLKEGVYKRILLDIPEAPPNMYTGETLLGVVPGYKTGFLIETGAVESFVVSGRLLHSGGEALVYQAGNLISPEEDQKGLLRFFTDEEGFFYIYGVSAGEYIIEIPGKGLISDPLVLNEEVILDSLFLKEREE